MCNHILGIDISKRTFDVALLDDESTYRSGQFANSPAGFQSLRRWLSNHSVDSLHACMEATGRLGDPLALFLVEEGYAVSRVNPAEPIRNFVYEVV